MHLPWHSAKWPFPGSWERTLPSAKVKTLGKVTTFAKCLSFWHVLSKVSDNSRFAGLFILFCRECFGTRQSFAECLRKGARKSLLLRDNYCRVEFAEYRTRQTLCRVQNVFCQVFRALGKEHKSGSDWWILEFRYRNCMNCFILTNDFLQNVISTNIVWCSFIANKVSC